jgi:hypothetical protein
VEKVEKWKSGKSGRSGRSGRSGNDVSEEVVKYPEPHQANLAT